LAAAQGRTRRRYLEIGRLGLFFGLGVGRQMYVVVSSVCSFFENITPLCCAVLHCTALPRVSEPCEKKEMVDFSSVSCNVCISIVMEVIAKLLGQIAGLARVLVSCRCLRC
jgi:hypothetical protein